MLHDDPLTASIKPPAKIFQINHENARALAFKSWENRRKKKHVLEAEASTGRLATPQSLKIAKQIGDIEDLMDGERDADVLQKLSAAHARLFSAWQVLTGTQNPGSRKAGSTRPKPAPAFDPTPATPQPVVSSVSSVSLAPDMERPVE